MKLPFLNQTSEREIRKPVPTSMPKLESMQIAAQYKGARMGGDFFDFVSTSPSRLVFVMMDIAGKRDEAMHIAAAVQERFRETAIEMFSAQEVNEAERASDLNIV